MRLTDRVHLVGSGANGFGLSDACDSHVYLVDGGTQAALIDAGAGLDHGRILELIDRSHVDRERIDTIFITHAHADHGAGAGVLAEALGASVVTSEPVKIILEGADAEAASVEVGKRAGTYPPDYTFRPSPVGATVAEGDRVRVGQLEIEVLETPGHAVGHLCFLVHSDDRTDLFSGDMLLFGGRIILQDTWDCDLSAYIGSVRRLAELSVDGLFPGHFSFSVDGGTRHLEAAAAPLERGGIPPVL